MSDVCEHGNTPSDAFAAIHSWREWEDETEGTRKAMRSMYTHIYMYVMYKYRAHIYEYVYVCIGNYTPRRHYMRL